MCYTRAEGTEREWMKKGLLLFMYKKQQYGEEKITEKYIKYVSFSVFPSNHPYSHSSIFQYVCPDGLMDGRMEMKLS